LRQNISTQISLLVKMKATAKFLSSGNKQQLTSSEHLQVGNLLFNRKYVNPEADLGTLAWRMYDLIDRMPNRKHEESQRGDMVLLPAGLTLFHGTLADFTLDDMNEWSFFSTNINPPIGLIGEKAASGEYVQRPRVVEYVLTKDVEVEMTWADLQSTAQIRGEGVIHPFKRGWIGAKPGEEEIRFRSPSKVGLLVLRNYEFDSGWVYEMSSLIEEGKLEREEPTIMHYDDSYVHVNCLKKFSESNSELVFLEVEDRVFSYYMMRQCNGNSRAMIALYGMVRFGITPNEPIDRATTATVHSALVFDRKPPENWLSPSNDVRTYPHRELGESRLMNHHRDSRLLGIACWKSYAGRALYLFGLSSLTDTDETSERMNLVEQGLADVFRCYMDYEKWAHGELHVSNMTWNTEWETSFSGALRYSFRIDEGELDEPTILAAESNIPDGLFKPEDNEEEKIKKLRDFVSAYVNEYKEYEFISPHRSLLVRPIELHAKALIGAFFNNVGQYAIELLYLSKNMFALLEGLFLQESFISIVIKMCKNKQVMENKDYAYFRKLINQLFVGLSERESEVELKKMKWKFAAHFLGVPAFPDDEKLKTIYRLPVVDDPEKIDFVCQLLREALPYVIMNANVFITLHRKLYVPSLIKSVLNHVVLAGPSPSADKDILKVIEIATEHSAPVPRFIDPKFFATRSFIDETVRSAAIRQLNKENASSVESALKSYFSEIESERLRIMSKKLRPAMLIPFEFPKTIATFLRLSNLNPYKTINDDRNPVRYILWLWNQSQTMERDKQLLYEAIVQVFRYRWSMDFPKEFRVDGFPFIKARIKALKLRRQFDLQYRYNVQLIVEGNAIQDYDLLREDLADIPFSEKDSKRMYDSEFIQIAARWKHGSANVLEIIRKRRAALSRRRMRK